uniref:tRNA pseudouridine synthase n=1 Tax=Poecilia mexicana TaxID=48701 RepID=A0A3B3Y1M3_9TELE
TMHNWARYLIFFQYIGTKYRSVFAFFPVFVQEAIKRLKPVNPVSLSVSSRTDAGVHALSNSAHFDLQRKNDKPPFTADVLVEALNFNLKEQQIRVTHAYRVPDDFHARYRAQSRTYVYRVALGVTHHTLLPLTDWNLCWGLRNTELDIDAMHEAAALLVGTHDFSSFRAVNSDLPFKNPVKTVDVVTIQPGSSFAHSHFHRWDSVVVVIQVRRMTGVLVAAGQGRLSVSQVKQILDARDTLAFPHDVAAPAYGLFLKSVDYKESGE